MGSLRRSKPLAERIRISGAWDNGKLTALGTTTMIVDRHVQSPESKPQGLRAVPFARATDDRFGWDKGKQRPCSLCRCMFVVWQPSRSEVVLAYYYQRCHRLALHRYHPSLHHDTCDVCESPCHAPPITPRAHCRLVVAAGPPCCTYTA